MEMQTIGSILSEFLLKARSFGIKFILGLGVLFVFLLLGMIPRRILFFISSRVKRGKSILVLFGRLAFSLLVILGIFFALGAAGVNVTAVVASLGLTGFAVGFALRDALSNMLAGVLIIIYKPFRVGDTISITGFEGEIIDIDLRYTTIRSTEKKILIPNGNIFTNPVTIFNRK